MRTFKAHLLKTDSPYGRKLVREYYIVFARATWRKDNFKYDRYCFSTEERAQKAALWAAAKEVTRSWAGLGRVIYPGMIRSYMLVTRNMACGYLPSTEWQRQRLYELALEGMDMRNKKGGNHASE